MKQSAVAVLLACTSLCAAADTVRFKSGACLKGTVVRVEGGKITFKSDDVGEVKIDEAKVLDLVTEKANTVQYKDRSTEEAVVALSNGTWSVAAGRKLDMGNVKAINPEIEKWHGSVNLAFSAARGNTVSENVTLLADVNRRWENDRFTANGGYYFAQSGDTKETKRKTENRVVLQAQEDHFWWKKFYTYVNGKYETDQIADLHHRFRIGLGLGYQWLEGDEALWGKWDFNQEVGLGYSVEKWRNAADAAAKNYCSFRYAHHLKYSPLAVSSLSFFHNLSYDPDVADWSDVYTVNADVGFTTVIWAGWNLLGKIEWDYNAAAPNGRHRSDMRYILGFGYKW